MMRKIEAEARSGSRIECVASLEPLREPFAFADARTLPMADKSNFTPEEWTRLLEAPMMAGMAVSAAEPSGLFGMLKESFATGKLLVQAKTDASANALVKAVAADYETAEGRKAASEGLRAKLGGGQPGEIKAKALDALRQVAALLAAKAPGDAAAFKAWLAQISQSVAEASKEGGFLGFGGVQVSEAEKATLAEISTAVA
jgi:hypothetical protein